MITKLFIDGTRRTPIKVKLKKEGDRAIDQIHLEVAYNVPVVVNKELLWLHDDVTLDYAYAIYNFQTSVS